MFDAGCMPATCAASVMNTPAEPARAPAGPTQTAMGTSLASIFWTMSRVASRWPPGAGGGGGAARGGSRAGGAAPGRPASRDGGDVALRASAPPRTDVFGEDLPRLADEGLAL